MTKFSLPQEIITMATAVIGNRGSGKTSTAVTITEECLERGNQVIVVDPLDVWWGIKSSSDGTKDGYPVVIIGGTHGDVPLTESSGHAIADFLIDNPLAAVLTLRHLSQASSRRFMTDFAEHFYHRKGEPGKSTPVLMVIDEAGTFIPQRVMGEQARLVGAIQSWVRQGRSAGIGCMLIDQRPATVNKDVLSQIELLVCHRLTGPQDRKALSEWIAAKATDDQQVEFMKTVATLRLGEAWFWSPQWLEMFERKQVPPRKTFDSSATPKPGSQPVVPKKQATVNIERLRVQLAESIQRAAEDDPKELRKRIKELEKQLSQSADRGKIQAEFQAKLDAKVDELESEKQEMITQLRKELFAVLDGIAAKVLSGEIKVPEKTAGCPAPLGVMVTQQKAKPVPVAKPKAVASSSTVSLPTGARNILIALAQRPQGLSAEQIGVRAGLSSSTGSFGTHLANLRRSEYIRGERSKLQITNQGLAALGSYDELPTGRALLEYWVRQLESGAAKILSALAEAYPETLNKEQIGAITELSHTTGSFGTHLAKLRRLELIEGKSDALIASAELFD